MSLNVYTSVITILLFVIIWFGLVIYLRIKQRTYPYLLLLTVFYTYIYNILDLTLLQFQSLLLLKLFIPHLLLRGIDSSQSLNLIPLITLTSHDLKTSLLNVLLFIPLGCLLPLLIKVSFKQVVLIGMLFSLTIELLQLVTGLAAHLTFRIADINDVIFNTLGTCIGYMLFIGCMRLYKIQTNRLPIQDKAKPV
jgi:glycopeptide antibiotics resistance protein